MTQLSAATILTTNQQPTFVNGTPHGRWWLSVDHCVHLIDDDPQFLDCVSMVLGSVELQVARYPSAERFLATHSLHNADCVLLDLRMPEMGGVDLLKVMQERHWRTPVLMLSAFSETNGVVQSIRHGAADYLLKPVDDRELLTKVPAALHKSWTDKVRSEDAQQRLSSLSDREREVMDLFVAAQTTRQVARQLGISPKTVEKHRLNAFAKLNVDSVPALIRLVLDL